MSTFLFEAILVDIDGIYPYMRPLSQFFMQTEVVKTRPQVHADVKDLAFDHMTSDGGPSPQVYDTAVYRGALPRGTCEISNSKTRLFAFETGLRRRSWFESRASAGYWKVIGEQIAGRFCCEESARLRLVYEKILYRRQMVGRVALQTHNT